MLKADIPFSIYIEIFNRAPSPNQLRGAEMGAMLSLSINILSTFGDTEAADSSLRASLARTTINCFFQIGL